MNAFEAIQYKRLGAFLKKNISNVKRWVFLKTEGFRKGKK